MVLTLTHQASHAMDMPWSSLVLEVEPRRLGRSYWPALFLEPTPPGVPGFRHACTERLPGFAQSRYPATQTIPVRATDDYLSKPLFANTCRQDPSSPACDAYKAFWPTFSSSLGQVVRDGSF